MALEHFKLPDVGEGLLEADILAWRVQPGDVVEVNQIIIEVETAKAAVELPSPWAGTVKDLLVAEGDTVPVGSPIIAIETAAADPGVTDMVPTTASAESAAPARQPVLVGYGPRAEGTPSRRRRSTAAANGHGSSTILPATPVEAPAPTPAAEPTPSAHAAFAPPAEPLPSTAGDRHRVLAKPPVRKLAKTLGVDLTTLTPTGPNGTISRADVEQAAGAPAPAAARPVASGERETRIPIRGVRKHTAAAMVQSAFTAPHVTEFVTVDVTETMELRDRVAARREFREVKVSPLLFVAKACLRALARTPQINAVWDEASGEIVVKHYVNLGIAAATERGLIVPNIKDADAMSLLELAQAMGALTETARAGRTTPADLTGGTFTITNVGVFGVDTGTPIINPGESAILAFGAVRKMPWVIGDEIVPRWVTQLALSFDHRLIDGQQGSEFLADVAAVLHDPGLALL
ncbi:MAG: dihydrolipoamide acetyltransferase family protein [Jatrophihabitans sp.]|uniref:dihydrolipoamide acetyltransferase family protein n=1 Tax=Jatrophihabitans sp. TaxID=1932789 RepID=UPI003F7E2E38